MLSITNIPADSFYRLLLFITAKEIRIKNVKIAALLFCNIIERPIYTKLYRIKNLRDSYVHPIKGIHDAHTDAKDALSKFIEITDWYVNKTVGKIQPGMSIRMEEIK